MQQPIIYNCPERCPIKKRCFIIKLEYPLKEQVIVLKKCDAKKGKDIRVTIGGERPP